MPFTEETEGFGTKLAYGSDIVAATPTYTELAKIVDIEPPDVTVAKVKTGNHSTTNKKMTYQPGWQEPGVIKCEIHFAKTLVATIEGTLFATMRAWRITYSDGSTHIGDGFITKKTPKTPLEDLAVYEIEIQTSGDWPFVAGP